MAFSAFALGLVACLAVASVSGNNEFERRPYNYTGLSNEEDDNQFGACWEPCFQVLFLGCCVKKQSSKIGKRVKKRHFL